MYGSQSGVVVTCHLRLERWNNWWGIAGSFVMYSPRVAFIVFSLTNKNTLTNNDDLCHLFSGMVLFSYICNFLFVVASRNVSSSYGSIKRQLRQLNLHRLPLLWYSANCINMHGNVKSWCEEIHQKSNYPFIYQNGERLAESTMINEEEILVLLLR